MKNTTSITIETDDGKYKLSALVLPSGLLAMPSFSFNDQYWDNSIYLLRTLYPFLQGKYHKIDEDSCKELKSTFNKPLRKKLKSMFKQAALMGFFRESLN